ncbi:HAD family phosphatase [Shimia sp.]|uniref:HAD family hydrolase n=1 Tax=Shimia sp. TaxID=1954381 RepID=UPI003299F440
MPRPAAFLFDMDGLLLDSERLMMRIFLEMTDELALDHGTSTEFFMGLIGTSSAETEQRVADFLPRHVKFADFMLSFRRRYATRAEAGIPLRPFAKDVLSRLRELDARIAVVTSTKGVLARQKLATAGLLPFLDHVRAGDEVRANKPDPAPYLQAAETLGVHPQDCVAFEDSDPGITAAVASGCHSFQIPDLRPSCSQLPDLGQEIATDLRDALRQLGLWNAPLS